MTVRAVLWDADGVLQRLPGFDELWTFLPEETRLGVLADIFADMPEVLTGRVEMDERLDRVLTQHDLGAADVERILATWSELPPVDEARAIVAGLRREGTVCVLATNQDTMRARQMRPIYEPLMDRCYFSCAIGLAKPATEFFTHVATDLRLDVGDLLFIDDSQTNVDGARAAGLSAECWHHEQGVDRLHTLLNSHGVLPG